MGKCLHCGKELTGALCCDRDISIDQIGFLFPLTDAEAKGISDVCNQQSRKDYNPENFVIEPCPGTKNAVLCKYKGIEGTVFIPEEIGGYRIVEIAPGAFSGNKHVGVVFLPEGILRIGAEAFSYCAKIMFVAFGTQVSFIDDTAFSQSCVWAFIGGNSYTDEYARRHRISFNGLLRFESVATIPCSWGDSSVGDAWMSEGEKWKIYSLAKDDRGGYYALLRCGDKTQVVSVHVTEEKTTTIRTVMETLAYNDLFRLLDCFAVDLDLRYKILEDISPFVDQYPFLEHGSLGRLVNEMFHSICQKLNAKDIEQG